jgi:hypothetical protein
MTPKSSVYGHIGVLENRADKLIVHANHMLEIYEVKGREGYVQIVLRVAGRPVFRLEALMFAIQRGKAAPRLCL